MKLEQAQATVIDYLKNPNHGWDEFTVPPEVHAAILGVLEILYDGTADEDPLTPGVCSLLHRHRDPAMA